MNYLELINSIDDILMPLIVIFGFYLGSFVNVVVARYPAIRTAQMNAESVFHIRSQGGAVKLNEETSKFPLTYMGRSYCGSCKSVIPLYANIPVISYVILKGRCIACATPYSGRYAVIEAIYGIGTLLLVSTLGLTEVGLISIAMFWVLMSMSLIDIAFLEIPDTLTLGGLWATLGLSAVGVGLGLSTAVVGAIVGYLSLYLINLMFKAVAGKEGIGHGDFKLLAFLGALMGPMAIPFICLASTLVGAIHALIATTRFRGDRAIPFGPSIAISGFVMYLIMNTDLSSSFELLNFIKRASM